MNKLKRGGRFEGYCSAPVAQWTSTDLLNRATLVQIQPGA